MEMKYDNGNEFRIVDMNKSCYIEPNTPHRLYKSNGDCNLIAVIIPGTKNFPKESKDGFR
jgi:hypothetical protein